jgi:hypothetical protein
MSGMIAFITFLASSSVIAGQAPRKVPLQERAEAPPRCGTYFLFSTTSAGANQRFVFAARPYLPYLCCYHCPELVQNVHHCTGLLSPVCQRSSRFHEEVRNLLFVKSTMLNTSERFFFAARPYLPCFCFVFNGLEAR